MTRTLLITRPDADNAALESLLREKGVHCVQAPLLHIERIAFSPPAAQPDALLLTSRHAAFACAAYPDTPLYAVGEQTAAAAQQQGCTDITATAPDMQSLLPLMPKQPRRILYFSGMHTRHDAAAVLPAHNVEQIAVYEAIASTRLPEAAEQALQQGGIESVVFYSPRTAAIFHALTPAAWRASLTAYCLSSAVAAMCDGWQEIRIAKEPTQNAMIGLLISGK